MNPAHDPAVHVQADHLGRVGNAVMPVQRVSKRRPVLRLRVLFDVDM